jgi:predicted flap endonuclease-1-like 5' DNA nuclease
MKIIDVEGIGTSSAAKLVEAGIETTQAFLEAAASEAGRATLAIKTGISKNLLLEWVNHVDLMRIKGVGSEFSDLLEAAGVDSCTELAQRNATNLMAKVVDLNATKKLVRQLPTEEQIQAWIEEAKTLPKLVTH